MGTHYRPYEPEQPFLLPPSLRDWLPEDHLAYFISDTIDQLDLKGPYAASLPVCVPTVEVLFVSRFLRLSPRGLRRTTSAPRFPTVTSIGPGRIVSSC